MSPLVSIIIPCYNGARYIPGLAESLRPVLAAQPERFEVVFVDDGSKDDSINLARQHLPGSLFLQQPNRGLSAARNAAVAAAQGEFLQLLDTDDTVEPGKLEVQTAWATIAAADVVYSDWRRVTVRGKDVRQEVHAPAQAPCEMVQALLEGWWVPPVCYLFRRSAYLELGGCDETIKVWEDFDLFLRFALAQKRHVYAPGVFSNYYRYLNVTSLSVRDPIANALSRERIILKTLSTLEQSNVLTQPRRIAAARALFGVLRTSGISNLGWLRKVAAKVYELDPDFRPTGPPAYQAAARILGIVRAERLAIGLRKKRFGRRG